MNSKVEANVTNQRVIASIDSSEALRANEPAGLPISADPLIPFTGLLRVRPESRRSSMGVLLTFRSSGRQCCQSMIISFSSRSLNMGLRHRQNPGNSRHHWSGLTFRRQRIIHAWGKLDKRHDSQPCKNPNQHQLQPPRGRGARLSRQRARPCVIHSTRRR